jgi:hypothetical protein
MMDFAEMRAYEAVVRERGFTAAARTLGLSKQRVSDLVRGLEDRLGVALLLLPQQVIRAGRGRQGARDYTDRPLHDLRSSAADGITDRSVFAVKVFAWPFSRMVMVF